MVGGYQIVDIDKLVEEKTITVQQGSEQDAYLALIYNTFRAFSTVGVLTKVKIKKPFVYRFYGNLFYNFTTYRNTATNSTYVCFKAPTIGYDGTKTPITFDGCPLPSQTPLLLTTKSTNNTENTISYTFQIVNKLT